MRFNYTYKITYGSGQCYDRWKHQLGIEITPEQYSKIIETVIQGRSISETTELEDVIQEMEENVRFVDRFQNMDGSSRNTPLKKERDITKIELLVPEDELRRIRKMKNPLEALTRSEEQMTIYRNSDGSRVIHQHFCSALARILYSYFSLLCAEDYPGAVTVTVNRHLFFRASQCL